MSIKCAFTTSIKYGLLIEQIMKIIDDANDDITTRMTSGTMEYKYGCSNEKKVTNDQYYYFLKKRIDKVVNSFVNKKPNKYNREDFDETDNSTITINGETKKIIDFLKDDDKPKIDLDNETRHGGAVLFSLDRDLMKNVKQIIEIIKRNKCYTMEIIKFIIKNYYVRYSNDFSFELLKKDIARIKLILKFAKTSTSINISTLNIEEEIKTQLNNLIDEKYKELRSYLVAICSIYYGKMPPIIWAQIIRKMYLNVMSEIVFSQPTPENSVPFGPQPSQELSEKHDLTKLNNELIQFVSKHILLNSGPCILKMLQTVRPLMKDEDLIKYNLKQLKYPKLSEDVFKKIMKNISSPEIWHDWEIEGSFSASVGHVCILNNKSTLKKSVIKIIKPISIAQGCWELKTLPPVFADKPCSFNYTRNILISNLREMNVNGEINNINKGHKLYSATYEKLFGNKIIFEEKDKSHKINSSLTTIKNEKNIFGDKPKWFAFEMSLADGESLSSLEEKEEKIDFTKDNVFRAKIHRCFDILLYKFIENLVFKGFYHGDLHSGNIFFSEEENKMTLIDFGAVGNFDISSKENSTIIKIIIMAIFKNYDEILEVIVDLINTKCPNEEGSKNIDKHDEKYLEIKKKLESSKVNGLKNIDNEKKNVRNCKKNLFSKERIFEENTKMDNNELSNKIDKDKKDCEKTCKIDKEKVDCEKTCINFEIILNDIIEFLALYGINIAVKLSDMFDIQKACLLLYGVLSKFEYPIERMQAIVDCLLDENVPDVKKENSLLTNIGNFGSFVFTGAVNGVKSFVGVGEGSNIMQKTSLVWNFGTFYGEQKEKQENNIKSLQYIV
jgi:hypothetical protein